MPAHHIRFPVMMPAFPAVSHICAPISQEHAVKKVQQDTPARQATTTHSTLRIRDYSGR